MAGQARPDWFSRYACEGCGAGYIQCAQGLVMSLMCCKDCSHPGRWSTNPPYTDDEIAEMWAEKKAKA